MSPDTRRLILLAAGGSLVLLTGAFLFQAAGYAPCELCWLQRWPHLAAVVIGGVALASNWRQLSWAGALAAATTGVLGVYHTGVERGLWIGPTSCSSTGIQGLSTDQLMTQILNAPLVRCNEVAWSLFGISMASWNALFSFALVLVWLRAARRP